MSLAVYSTQFFLKTVATGNFSIPVPAGYVAVLRDADLTWQSSSAGVFSLWINDANIVTIPFNAGELYKHGQWSGRAVAKSGDLLSAQSDQYASYHVSGYLLTLP